MIVVLVVAGSSMVCQSPPVLVKEHVSAAQSIVCAQIEQSNSRIVKRVNGVSRRRDTPPLLGRVESAK